MNLDVLHRSGTFDDIADWFRDTHGVEVKFSNIRFSKTGNVAAWSGLVLAADDFDEITRMFRGTNIEVWPAYLANTDQAYDFIMLADEWPSLLMMQELSRE